MLILYTPDIRRFDALRESGNNLSLLPDYIDSIIGMASLHTLDINHEAEDNEQLKQIYKKEVCISD